MIQLYKKNDDWTRYINFIQILNRMGYNIIYIANSFYIYTEVIIPDDALHEIRVQGKDVTTLIENATNTMTMDQRSQSELVTRIEQMKDYVREFHKNINYIKFNAG